jgi:dihydrolipoamide dehydrogenase
MDSKYQTYDVIVLGGGPGGYPAAIRAAQNGKNVALVEAGELGGTCLNRGCIPSKTLIANGERLKQVREAGEFGIDTGAISFDFAKMAQRKDRIVAGIRKSLEGLILANKIRIFRGYGKFLSKNEIAVGAPDEAILSAPKIVIATGSEPREMAAFPFDGEKVHNSTTLLQLEKLPKSIVIIGGGIIGCEFASLYIALGVKVSVVEMMATILPMEGESVSAALTKVFVKKGIAIHTNGAVKTIDKNGEGVTVRLADGQAIEASIALVAVGRTLNTNNIGLEKAGVAVGANGIIPVSDTMETNVPGIYAVGDIASKWWLAHVASHQGLVAGDNVSGKTAHIDYNAVPSVIYTDPEIATVGMSLEAAISANYPATVAAFPFQALGKSQAILHTEGFAQIVIDRHTGQILGAQVVGYQASTLIAEMAIAIANELTVESIAETIHAHPTVAEAWLEAALLVTGSPLHLPPKIKKS